MIFLRMASVLAPLLCGYVLVRIVLGSARAGHKLLAVALCGGVGCGWASIAYSGLNLLGMHDPRIIGSLEVVLVVLLLGLWLILRQVSAREVTKMPQNDSSAFLPLKAIIVLLLFIVVIAALAFSNPHGGWDAWAIWNARARAMFRLGEQWREAFSFGQHLDYPVLIPAFTARSWSLLGFETTTVAVLQSVGVLASLLLLYGVAICKYTGNRLAALAALGTLIAIPFCGRLAVLQYSDLPLAYFLLASVVLIDGVERGWLVRRGYVLAGMTIGLSAWTKNEGGIVLYSCVGIRGAAGAVVAAVKRSQGEGCFFCRGAASGSAFCVLVQSPSRCCQRPG
jgi:hypothetical protein